MRPQSRDYPRRNRGAIRTALAAAVLAAGAAGCVPDRVATPMPIDLLRELPRAARGPAAEADERIRVELVDGPDGVRPALVMHPTSRVIWQVQMAERAELRTTIARLPGSDPGATLSVRLGVSDERIYEDHFRETLDPPPGDTASWRPITIDLSLYSGPKWSLFHQPSRRLWSLVLNVQGDGQTAVALVEPVISAPSNRPGRPARSP